MFWICTNVDINWDAIAAISTAGATIVALTVWIYSIWSQHKQRKAKATMLAALILPDVRMLTASLKHVDEIFWKFENPTTEDEREAAIKKTCRELADSNEEAIVILEDSTRDTQTESLDAFIKDTEVFYPSSYEVFAKLFHHLSYFRRQRDSFLHDLKNERLRKDDVVEVSLDFHNAAVGALRASTNALEALFKIAEEDPGKAAELITYARSRPLCTQRINNPS